MKNQVERALTAQEIIIEAKKGGLKLSEKQLLFIAKEGSILMRRTLELIKKGNFKGDWTEEGSNHYQKIRRTEKKEEEFYLDLCLASIN